MSLRWKIASGAAVAAAGGLTALAVIGAEALSGASRLMSVTASRYPGTVQGRSG